MHTKLCPRKYLAIKSSLPYMYRNRVTVESEFFKNRVRAEIQHLREYQASPETVIRMKTILGKSGASEDFETDKFTAMDGQTLYYSKWKSKEPRHVFIFINGLESHAGWFSGMAAEFAHRNIVTYGLDRRGSGLNVRFFGGLSNWIADIDLLIKIAKSENPFVKIHLVSVCFGAKLATAYAVQQPEKIDSLIYLSPGINVKVKTRISQKLKIALSVLTGLSCNVPSPINNDKMFTDSPQSLYFLYNDKLRLISPRASDFFQAAKLDSYISKNSHKIMIPSLVLLAGNDQIVDNTKTKIAFQRFGQKPKIIEYHDSEHVIFFGPAKNKLIADIFSFVEA